MQLEFSQGHDQISIGIRLLLWTAKAVVSKGGEFVMLNPRPSVDEVLDMTGMKALIPVYSDEYSAIADLLGHTATGKLSKKKKEAG